MPTIRRSLDTLQAGRALAALAVCIYHTNLTLALPKYLGVEVLPQSHPGDSGVYYFFVLSGFVIFLVHEKDIGRRDATAGFLWKRIRRIYPPLWGILLLLLPILWLVPSFEGGAARDVGTVLSALFALPVASDPILGPEWTLRHEVLFYLMFALVIFRPWLGAIVGGGWLVLSALSCLLPVPEPIAFFVSGFHLLFAFGVMTCFAYRRGYCTRPALTLSVGVALFTLVWALQCLGIVHHGVVTSWAYGAGAALSILGGAALELKCEVQLPRSVLFLGEASYSIYLVNLPAIALIAKLATHFRGTVPSGMLFVATLALSVGAGILFHLFVEQPLVALFRQPWRPGGLKGATGQAGP